MGRFCRIAAFALLAAGLTAAAQAQALPDSVEIQNRRTGTIEDLRLSPDFESSWGYNRLRAAPLAPGASVTVPFTAAWTTTAAATDGSGLYVVGAVLVFLGLAAATTVVSAVTVALRRS